MAKRFDADDRKDHHRQDIHVGQYSFTSTEEGRDTLAETSFCQLSLVNCSCIRERKNDYFDFYRITALEFQQLPF